jgi:hypothetical protein
VRIIRNKEINTGGEYRVFKFQKCCVTEIYLKGYKLMCLSLSGVWLIRNQQARAALGSRFITLLHANPQSAVAYVDQSTFIW